LQIRRQLITVPSQLHSDVKTVHVMYAHTLWLIWYPMQILIMEILQQTEDKIG